MSCGDARRSVDVVELHLDARDAVAVLVECLRLVEIGVDELRVVLVEARLEDGDDPELLGDGGARAGAERQADLRARSPGRSRRARCRAAWPGAADDDAGHLGDLFGALARIRIDRVRQDVVIGKFATKPARGGDRSAGAPRIGRVTAGAGASAASSSVGAGGVVPDDPARSRLVALDLAANELQQWLGPSVGVVCRRGARIELGAKRIARALGGLGVGPRRPSRSPRDVLGKVETLGKARGRRP